MSQHHPEIPIQTENGCSEISSNLQLHSGHNIQDQNYIFRSSICVSQREHVGMMVEEEDKNKQGNIRPSILT